MMMISPLQKVRKKILSHHFVPILDCKLTENDIIRNSAEERQSTMSWPVSKVPIRTEGYISCAFQTLFPTGEGDFSSRSNLRQLFHTLNEV